MDRRGGLLAVPVLGALVVGTTNWVTGDTSAAAQVFLVVPVLLGATQLRAAGAQLSTGLGVLVSGLATVPVEPTAQGLTDAVVVGSASRRSPSCSCGRPTAGSAPSRWCTSRPRPTA